MQNLNPEEQRKMFNTVLIIEERVKNIDEKGTEKGNQSIRRVYSYIHWVVGLSVVAVTGLMTGLLAYLKG